MAFEMICGQCRGNLLVEHFGVVVACPHCGAHLNIPAPAGAAAPTLAPVPPAPTPVVLTQPAPISAPPPAPPVVQTVAPVTPVPIPVSAPTPPAPTEIENSPVEISPVPESSPAIAATNSEAGFSLEGLFATQPDPTESNQAAPDHSEPEDPVPDFAVPDFAAPNVSADIGDAPTVMLDSQAAASDDAAPVQIADVTAVPLSDTLGEAMTEDVLPQPESARLESAQAESFLDEHTTESSTTTPSPKSPRTEYVSISKTMFLLLLSYASAMTLGFVILYMKANAPSSGDGLESLPDLEPPKVKGKAVRFLLLPEKAVMPDGHELEIGDSQRFGNIKVTALKVTRGPVRFVHFSGKRDEAKLPTFPVLKLWLKFENVSKDQEIAPLDPRLLFSRDGKDRFTWRGNQFVYMASEKAKKDAVRVLAYDHAFQSQWDLENLPLRKSLKPSESREYYVPTGENDVEKLTGDLVWRVHIRKGFSKYGNGVTTVFEVRFNSKDIQDEPA